VSALFLLLTGCTTVIVSMSPIVDAAVDARHEDVLLQTSDADSRRDSRAEPDASPDVAASPDASVPLLPDAETSDASSSLPDAAPDVRRLEPPPPPTCAPDGLEPDDDPATAPIVAEAPSAAFQRHVIIRTTPPGDTVDWAVVQMDFPLLFGAQVIDADANVTVRYTCAGGTLCPTSWDITPDGVCYSTRRQSVGNILACRRAGERITAWVGVERLPGGSCEYTTRITIGNEGAR
jgi:hypothetical protein